MASGNRFNIVVPPGGLGVVVAEDSQGQCRIHHFRSPNLSGALAVGDLLLAVNGIPLELKKGVLEWCNLIQSQDKHGSWRTLTVFRPPPATPRQPQAAAAAAVAKRPPPMPAPRALPKQSSREPQKLASVTSTAAERRPPKVQQKPVKSQKNPKALQTKVVNHKKKTSSQTKPTKKTTPQLAVEDYPDPGFVCRQKMFYCTLDNETPTTVAEKLGCSSWKEVADTTTAYGTLQGSSRFHAGTVLRIPTTASKWKLEKLVNKQDIKMQEWGVCIHCQQTEQPGDTMLLCDGCDAASHLPCASLTRVPAGEWFCPSCLDILAARKRVGVSSLVVHKPTAPGWEPPYELQRLKAHLNPKLHKFLGAAKQQELLQVRRYLRTLTMDLREAELVLPSLQRQHAAALAAFNRVRPRGYWWSEYELSPQARQLRAVERDAQSQLCDCHANITSLTKRIKTYNVEKESLFIQSKYAGLLGLPRLPGESMTMCANREIEPRLLGFVTPRDQSQVAALLSLTEPDMLVCLIPLEAQNVEDDVLVDHEYAVYARLLLFDRARDDEVPVVSGGVREAQKILMRLLMESPRTIQYGALVQEPTIPDSVRLRDQEDENTAACFDLSELVRDCTCDLDLPQAPTPKRLFDNGLRLRQYQQASLKWMLDKEKEGENGVGIASELWAQMRTMNGELYYYCELTGTFSMDIFDYRGEMEMADATLPCGSLPAGGILGEEMGLGKTVCSLALIEANPPPMHKRLLPRENLWKDPVTHEAYTPPPTAICSAGKSKLVSNGTLVVAPMTLCSQWEGEVKKFAPWLNVLTIHNSEKYSAEEIATADIVICSTFLLQARMKARAGILQKNLKRVHFHRVIVDESHINQREGGKTQQSLACISSTYRWCSTGTPIGHSLADLHGQLRFLRLPQFTRTNFWKNAIADPYSARNRESLRILRSLLSRVIVRHSKEQTLASGVAMLELPPRRVTTEIIAFGSEAEKAVYDALEARNRARFEELRAESNAKVLGSYMDFVGIVYSTRQMCGHASIIDLFKLESFNQKLEYARRSDGRKNQHIPSEKKCTRAGILEEAIAKAKTSAENRVRHLVSQFQQENLLLECPVCFDAFDEQNASIIPCGHAFCSDCVINFLDGGTQSREASGTCPTCRSVFSRSQVTFLGEAEDVKKNKVEQVQTEDAEVSAEVNGFSMIDKQMHVSATIASSTRRAQFQEFTSAERRELRAYLSTLNTDFLNKFEIASNSVGTKVARLLHEIQEMIKNDSTSKAVCFSQFLGVLDIAGQELTSLGIEWCRIDGSMKQHERADALDDFSGSPSVKVLLLSMRSGAVGLTLTAANHCFLMDVAPNAAVEEQAIDRIHRIGQTRPVTVKRFVMEGTVEERILASRRSIAADRPSVSTQLDGASLMKTDEETSNRPSKRARLDEETEIHGSTRFDHLMMILGCKVVVPDTREAEKA